MDLAIHAVASIVSPLSFLCFSFPFSTHLAMAKRRRFVVLLSGALSTTLLLTGCLGNPPNRQGGTATAAITKVPVAANNADLEVKTVSLGYIPILEAAPLVVGSRKASSPGMAWR
jgi:bicarbonate transport system substrate-binding protein